MYCFAVGVEDGMSRVPFIPSPLVSRPPPERRKEIPTRVQDPERPIPPQSTSLSLFYPLVAD